MEIHVRKSVLKLARHNPGCFYSTGSKGGVYVRAQRAGEEWTYTFEVPNIAPSGLISTGEAASPIESDDAVEHSIRAVSGFIAVSEANERAESPKPIDQTSYKPEGGWQPISKSRVTKGESQPLGDSDRKYRHPLPPQPTKTLNELMQATFEKSPQIQQLPQPEAADVARVALAALEIIRQESDGAGSHPKSKGRKVFARASEAIWQIERMMGRWDDSAVRSSEFGVAPQVGKMLLDGIKRIRDHVRQQPIGNISAQLNRADWVFNEMLALIAEAEKPGLPVPAEPPKPTMTARVDYGL